MKTKIYFLNIIVLILLTNTLLSTDTTNLVSPANGAINQHASVTLDWSSVTGNNGYLYEIDTTPLFNSTINLKGNTSINSSQTTVPNLYFGTKYYWRAAVKGTTDTSNWTSTRFFTTTDSVFLTSPANGATNRHSSVTLDWNSITGNKGYLYEIDTTPLFNSTVNLKGNTVTNSSQITVSNLYFGTKYYWRAAVKNNTDTSNWTTLRFFTTTDSVVLTSPANGAINRHSSVTLDWNSITGNKGYLYEIDTTPLFNSTINLKGNTVTNSSQITVTNLYFGTKYYWRAAVKNNTDTSNWTTARYFTTTDSVVLTSPANGAINRNISIILDWSSITGNNGYLYEIDIIDSFNSSQLVSGNTAINSSQAAMSGLLYGTKYYWRAAVKNSIDTSNWTHSRSFTTSYQLTTAPNLTSPINNSVNIPKNGQNFTWNSISSATSYYLQYSIDSTFACGVNFKTPTSINTIISGLTSNTTYFWRVRGKNLAGNSPWSAIWKYKTKNCSVSNSIANTSCGSYNFNGNILNTSGIYKDTILTPSGCDSVITLNLTVTSIDTSLTTINQLISSNTTSATYQWLDCDNGFAKLSGETSKTFLATSNGNFAVEITKNSCIDTSRCYSIYGIGLNENQFEKVNLFPNPTNGKIRIDFKMNLDKIKITQIDITGKLMNTSNYLNQKNIDFELLGKSGIYIINIETSKGNSTKIKVIKN